MSDGGTCTGKCPVDARERDAIWSRLDELRTQFSGLDRVQTTQQGDLHQLSSRIDAMHSQLIERMDSANDKLDELTVRVRADSDELRRREGAAMANKRWSWLVVSVLGLVFSAGGYIVFQPASGAVIPKDIWAFGAPATRIERVLEP